jgi:hypothetical protein
MTCFLSVIACELATGFAQTALGSSQVGSGAAEILIHLMGQIIEQGLEMIRGGPQKHDVAGGAVQVGKAASVSFPQTHQLAKELRGVVLARGLVHADGVEVRNAGEQAGLIAISSDDAAAVAEDSHDSAVLPVGDFVYIRKFQYAQKIVGRVFENVFTFFRLLLDIGNEAWPRALFQFIKHRGIVFSH